MTVPLLLLRHAGYVPSTDAELLDRFTKSRDESAFAELVRRHGPVVYRICRRLAGAAGADDAFQATFLVLATRTAAARAAGALGGWLVGVAGRVARQTRRGAERRVRHEAAAAHLRPEMCVDDSLELADQFRVLDEELARLPAALRGPMVLCMLQGRTQEQAAAELGRDARTLRRHLERAKAVLRARLERRGVVPMVATALVTGTGTVVAVVPDDLTRRTVGLVFDFLTGGAVASTSPPVALAKGVTTTMPARKLLLGAATVALGLVGFGFALADNRPPEPAPPPPVKTVEPPPENRAHKAPVSKAKSAQVIIEAMCVRVQAGFREQIGLTTDAPSGVTLTARESLMLKALLRHHPMVEILFRPQVQLQSGQMGHVGAWQELPVVTGLEGEVRDGKTVYVAKSEPVSLGHKLRILPTVEADGQVTIRIEGAYTELERPVSSTTSLDRLAAPTPRGDLPLELGSVNIHNFQATARVSDGQTAVFRSAAPVPTAGVVVHPMKAPAKSEPMPELLWVLTSHVVRSEQDAARVLANIAPPPPPPPPARQ
ncbi:ECF RNA polymerase sigma factor SigE [Gemmata obscuriglobus]|uniref:ECF RNA polymerase sigma factor SigE n=1 Tax=Gemmata obscuriglobus TaxID=114 RepID=A0A2Z3H9S1_9BACT|nr:sigma-70 family RNA polymerase sigma factor [Gemmata obscuriglobus]AWM38424.1 hypothetical protein C1280_16450 [Gemmata obscuriglobus]QEG28652.1 ECF RNA polymerase sigma factor SigE [Gemmata obscuriglobus]VTS06860.1 sigma-70 family rna polymerase sigma factor : RNA polymerase sigma factor, sigma-70 family OS=Singulisphaera acidiphila (strain ATCC BAA-1392 / DSM 18658 / VKM B-2454 / MOB10) GN=Sinac_4264 PE=4 SV=1: Sigma70_r2: Sigma70_r4_2: Secretin [Gemmata obscuriglobus UQM 2246]